jgi:hypothetical protein
MIPYILGEQDDSAVGQVRVMASLVSGGQCKWLAVIYSTLASSVQPDHFPIAPTPKAYLRRQSAMRARRYLQTRRSITSHNLPHTESCHTHAL